MLRKKKKKKKISENNHEKTVATSIISVNNNKLAMAEDNFSGNPQIRDLGTTEEDEEVERLDLDKVTGSVSQYSSARESLHSEYMAVIPIILSLVNTLNNTFF